MTGGRNGKGYGVLATPFRCVAFHDTLLHTEKPPYRFPHTAADGLFAEQVAVRPGAGKRQHQHIILDTVNELMTQDEIAVMDGGKCILQLRGVRPFFSDKYDITQHPNYKYLSDFDKKNAFDVERYMSTRPAIVKPDEPFDIYEIDLSDEDAAAE